MNPPKPALEAWKSEEQNQTQILAERLNAVIIAAGKEFDVPLLNAVAGAIVTVQAYVLASIADPHHRKLLRRAMERQLPIALAQALNAPRIPTEVIFVGGPQQ